MLNKILIPAALVATVVIAGIFAFMPVEKASTVHGTLTSNTNNQDRTIYFTTNMTFGVAGRADANNLLLIPAGTNAISIAAFTLAAIPTQGTADTQWECGLTDGTNSLLTRNASKGSPINGTTIAGLGGGEGLYLQVDTKDLTLARDTSGVCTLYAVIDSYDG